MELGTSIAQSFIKTAEIWRHCSISSRTSPATHMEPWTIGPWASHFCRWDGITCTWTRRQWRVLSLTLTGKSLSGQISSSLGNLTFLNYLDLSQNNFFGPLPLLGGLQQLQYLFLNNNNLSGNIPDALTNCSNLTYLDISTNSLVGSISPKFGLLSNLVSVSLADNQLNGSIPSELGQLRNLEYLILGGNRISGQIPASIFSLSSLTSLSLDSNMLDKASLPPNIGELFPNLVQLTLENNSFEGPIPASLGNALGLEMIDLSLNNFSGKIPTSLGKLSNLTILNLQHNQLVAKDNHDWEFLNALTVDLWITSHSFTMSCRDLYRCQSATYRLAFNICCCLPTAYLDKFQGA